VRLFAAGDGCLWKDQKQFAGWRLRIGARFSQPRLSPLSTPFRFSHPLAAPFERTALLIRSTNGTETRRRRRRRRGSIPRRNSDLIKRHAHRLTFFRVLNRGEPASGGGVAGGGRGRWRNGGIECAECSFNGIVAAFRVAAGRLEGGEGVGGWGCRCHRHPHRYPLRWNP